MLLLRKISTA